MPRNIYRSRIGNTPLGRELLKHTEVRLREKIRFVRSDESEFDPNEKLIKIGPISSFRKIGLDATWTNHLLFHEFGHAVAEAFRERFDRKAERKHFAGLTTSHYESRTVDRILRNPWKTINRSSVTNYGKTHPEEAWAEAFSFVLANVDDSGEPPEVIAQLAFVDWAIDNIISGRKKWGRFKIPTVEVECECGCTFDLECRSNCETKGWEVDCPDCGETLIIED